MLLGFGIMSELRTKQGGAAPALQSDVRLFSRTKYIASASTIEPPPLSGPEPAGLSPLMASRIRWPINQADL
jgi:hypothetical protein